MAVADRVAADRAVADRAVVVADRVAAARALAVADRVAAARVAAGPGGGGGGPGGGGPGNGGRAVMVADWVAEAPTAAARIELLDLDAVRAEIRRSGQSLVGKLRARGDGRGTLL